MGSFEASLKKVPWNIVAGVTSGIGALYSLFMVVRSLVLFHFFSIRHFYLHYFLVFTAIAVLSILAKKKPWACAGHALMVLFGLIHIIQNLAGKYAYYTDSWKHGIRFNIFTMLPELIQLLAYVAAVVLILVLVMDLGGYASLCKKLFFAPAVIYFLGFFFAIIVNLMIKIISRGMWYGKTNFISLYAVLVQLFTFAVLLTSVAVYAYGEKNKNDIFDKVNDLASNLGNTAPKNAGAANNFTNPNPFAGNDDPFGGMPQFDSTPGNQGQTMSGSMGAFTGTPAPGPMPQASALEQIPGYQNMMLHSILLLFTFGIWSWIWIYKTTDYLNCMQDEPQRNTVAELLLSMFVPFYSVYWLYKTSQRVDKLARYKGIHSDLTNLSIVLGLFVFMAGAVLVQDKINTVLAAGMQQ